MDFHGHLRTESVQVKEINPISDVVLGTHPLGIPLDEFQA